MTNSTTLSNSIMSLNTYALLKSSWINEDFISSFIPLVTTLFNKKQYETIDANMLSIDFEQEYGVKLPLHPSTKLLSLMQKQNYLLFDKDIHMWRPQYTEFDGLDISQKRELINEKHRNIIKKLVAYAKEKYNQTLDESQANMFLSSFIQINSYSLISRNNSDFEFEKLPVVAAFINDLKETCFEDFQTIREITVGKLLVDAISLKEIESDKTSFKGANIYLDTRYILNLIGFYGEYREKSYIDLTEKLLNYNAKLFVFSHTLEEVNFTLKNCELWVESISYSPDKASSALRYLKNSNKDKKYVQDLIVTIDEKFDHFQINIDEFDYDTSNHQYQIDESKLEAGIKECYMENEVEITDKVEKTIKYDVRSISAIYHKRKGQNNALYINKCKAFLLTTNRNLVYASKIFHKTEFGDTLQTCISDVVLGTYIWARSGIEICDEIMEMKLISDCSAAMQPSQNAINKFCTIVDELTSKGDITTAQCIALKCFGLSTEVAKPKLVTKEEYTYSDIYEVMDEIKQSTTKEQSIKFDKERSELNEYIGRLLEENNITKQELEKYKEIIEEQEKAEVEAKKQEMSLMQDWAKKAEKTINIWKIFGWLVFNIIIEIMLIFVADFSTAITIALSITSPTISAIGALMIHCNWFSLHDAIKLRLILKYKSKYEKKINMKNIKTSLANKNFIS